MSPDDPSLALLRRFADSRSVEDRNAVVEEFAGFARHVSRRYSNRGVGDDDLHQIAMLALVKAVDRFDLSKGVKFTTFAGRTIEGEIKHHFRDATWAVKVPRSLKDRHLLVRQTEEALRRDLGAAPTASQIAERIGVDVDVVIEALDAGSLYSTTPIDAPTGPDRTSIADRVGTSDERVEELPDRLLLDELIAGLPEREREILRLRFVEERSQQEIAGVVGVSQMHVSRLLRRSLDLLRRQAEQ